MKTIYGLIILLMLFTINSYAGKWDFLRDSGSGEFSVGTRNAFSHFSDMQNESAGIGIGGQFRVQFSDRINSEWFLDYISSEIGSKGIREDYHIGWSLMYYFDKTPGFKKLLKPYLLLGHCFDYTEVTDKEKPTIGKSRFSMATQAGLGTHFNITPQLDISLSTQYMLHFGKEIEAHEQEGVFIINQAEHNHVGGHLLTVLSINYKIAKLW